MDWLQILNLNWKQPKLDKKNNMKGGICKWSKEYKGRFHYLFHTVYGLSPFST